MKKLLLFLFFIPALVRSQTTNIATLPIYTGNLDSAKVVGSINGLSKNFWGVDLKRGVVKYTDTASMFAGYMRLGSYATTAQNALKLNVSDTSSMLTNYRHWLAGYLTSTTGDARYYTKTLADARYLQSESDPKRIVSIAVTGTNTKTITATLADNTTVTTTFTDLQGTGGGSFTFTGTSSQYVAGDGSYVTFPTIPTTTSQLTNNSGFITSSSLSPYLTSATAASTYATQSALTTTNSNVTTNTSAIGALSGLTTTAKSNLVAAINEVNAKPSGGGSLSTTQVYTAYVDSAYGNNSTAVVGNISLPFATIQAAHDALPSRGGVIKLSVGSYAKPTSITKEVSLIGSGTPSPNWTVTQSTLSAVTYSTPTKLIGGTIILGGFHVQDVNNIKIKNLGIDNGSDYVTGGGTEYDALGILTSGTDETANTPSPSYTILKGIEIENVVLLAKNSASLYHALVLHDMNAPKVNNVLAINGVHGVAIKTTKGFFRNITTYNNDWDGIIVKSNNYSVASQNIIDGFNINNAGAGIIIENKSGVQMKNVTFSNGYINGCATGVTTVNTSGNGFDSSTITFHTVNVTGATTPFANTSNYRYWGSAGGAFVQNYIGSTTTTGGGGGGGGTTYHSSAFTTTTGTLLTAYTPETGSAWTNDLGSWTINSNRAENNGSITDALSVTDVGQTDYTITTVVKATTTSANPEILVRETDASNKVVIVVDNANITAYNGVAGAFSSFGSGAISRGTTDHTYTVIVSGTALTVKMDGTTIISATIPSAQTGTKVGIGGAGLTAANQVSFDSFVVTN
jgi:hypothetical protein